MNITITNVPTCESCGQPADIRLEDDSTWCESCNVAAHNLGYDKLQGKPITLMEVRSS